MSAPPAERLRSADPRERAAACRDAVSDPAGALLAEALVAALADPDAAVARAAGEALVALARGGSGDAIVPLVRRAARSGTGRAHAALALVRLEPPEPALLPALVDALASADGGLRWTAARALVDMGRLHGEVATVLVGLVQGGAPVVRRMATFCLRELAPDQPAAAQALLAASRDGDAHVRRAALTAMAGLLDAPPPIVARLLEALGEPDDTAAGLAALALAEIAVASPGDTGLRLRARLDEERRRARAPAVARTLEGAIARIDRRHPGVDAR